MLKDEPLLNTGGICRLFWWTQLDITWVWSVREVKIFLSQSLDLSGPTWGEARAEKYYHPSGTPPEVAAP